MAYESYDVRGFQSPCGRICKVLILPSGGSVITGSYDSQTDGLNILTKQIHFKIPDLTGTGSAAFLITDTDGNTLYDTGYLSESTTHVLNVERALCGSPITFNVRTDADQTAAASFVITIYGV